MKYFLFISILLFLYISCVIAACNTCGSSDQWCNSCQTCSNGAIGNTCCSHDDCSGSNCCDYCTKKCTSTLSKCNVQTCSGSSTTKSSTTKASTTGSSSSSTTGSSSGTTHTNVYITSYGWNDNDDGSGSYGNDIIAYPNVKHGRAIETYGSYSDPCTFATESRFLAPGTIIYVPHVQKYYIMEDGCRSCTNDWNAGKKRPNAVSDQNKLYACENAVTRSSASIIVNPPSNLPVATTKIFINGVCSH